MSGVYNAFYVTQLVNCMTNECSLSNIFYWHLKSIKGKIFNFLCYRTKMLSVLFLAFRSFLWPISGNSHHSPDCTGITNQISLWTSSFHHKWVNTLQPALPSVRYYSVTYHHIATKYHFYNIDIISFPKQNLVLHLWSANINIIHQYCLHFAYVACLPITLSKRFGIQRIRENDLLTEYKTKEENICHENLFNRS